MFENVVIISPDQVLEDRPFTHPSFTVVESAVLDDMLASLCRYVEARSGALCLPAEVIPEPDGRFHRYLVPETRRLFAAADVAVVGFFGQRRANAQFDHFGNLGERLIEEIPAFEGILSYSTMELESGNFANLVLLAVETVKERWRLGDTHNRAVQRSSAYYDSIRIYNGELARISPSEPIRLSLVKYWDYGSDPVWRGIRSLV